MGFLKNVGLLAVGGAVAVAAVELYKKHQEGELGWDESWQLSSEPADNVKDL